MRVTTFDKAIVSFTATAVTALVAIVNTGTVLDLKSVLLALGSAVVSSGLVYGTPNKASVVTEPPAK